VQQAPKRFAFPRSRAVIRSSIQAVQQALKRFAFPRSRAVIRSSIQAVQQALKRFAFPRSRAAPYAPEKKQPDLQAGQAVSLRERTALVLREKNRPLQPG